MSGRGCSRSATSCGSRGGGGRIRHAGVRRVLLRHCRRRGLARRASGQSALGLSGRLRSGHRCVVVVLLHALLHARVTRATRRARRALTHNLAGLAIHHRRIVGRRAHGLGDRGREQTRRRMRAGGCGRWVRRCRSRSHREHHRRLGRQRTLATRADASATRNRSGSQQRRSEMRAQRSERGQRGRRGQIRRVGHLGASVRLRSTSCALRCSASRGSGLARLRRRARRHRSRCGRWLRLRHRQHECRGIERLSFRQVRECQRLRVRNQHRLRGHATMVLTNSGGRGNQRCGRRRRGSRSCTAQ